MTRLETLLEAIATSKFSRAERYALVQLALGTAKTASDFVPWPWNRQEKATAAIRKLEKANLLTVSSSTGVLLLLETSLVALAQGTPSTRTEPRMLLPLDRDTDLAVARAEVARLEIEAQPGPAGPSCPGQDDPSVLGRTAVLSRTGHDPNNDPPMGSDLSCPGQDRRSKRSNNSIDRFDDRSGPGQDRLVHGPDARAKALGYRDHWHEAANEKLARDGRLARVRAEFLKGQSPTARRLKTLMETDCRRANELLGQAAGKGNPGAYLNSVLARENVPL